ncbi:phage portal protein [Rickettsia endosymbiont of Cardiosporidium cionae]|uniref:phage portal protein n=1 Tax=Rickettsia endosymbiont of Cardiosporidium cionae TaxID=2777155 RepID=UPI0018932740|nr:phage portal protein [Rickettsia endosymbiont of Cardiosporidium cionae]KAF8818501.1 phage portal protein [Rickettsia endosymbiont of Cardiosporidium cionae]
MLEKYLKKIFDRSKKKSFDILDLPTHILSDDKTYSTTTSNDKQYYNIIVHKCINLIATSASHVPWLVYTKTRHGTKKLQEHPALKLLKFPNPETTGTDFFFSLIANMLIHGDSYLVTRHKKNDFPHSIYILNSENVSVVTNTTSVVGYRHKIGDYEKLYYINPVTRVSRVLHLKNYNPNSQHKGLSALDVAVKSINLYSRIIEWNMSLLNNSSKPTGALIFKDSNGYLTDEQFYRLKEQFYDNFTGVSNSGKPLILEGGLQWQEMHHQQKLEKFLELKDSISRDIAIVFNVPPQLLGIIGDNTYSNMQEARLSFWEENIIPLLNKLSGALSHWLSCWFNEELIIHYDLDSISALNKKRERLWERISGADFMTLNEKRAIVGLAPLEDGDNIQNE